jgi:hypothetical protein
MTQVFQPGRISPDIGNVTIGKGFVLFQPVGATAYYHLGNIPKLTITPKAELLKHYDSQAGIKNKNLTVANAQEMEIEMELEEISAGNLQLLFQGSVDWTNPAAPVVQLMALSQLEGHLKFFQSNIVGPRWYFDLPSVTFFPSGNFAGISDSFNNMKVLGTVNYANNVWGTATLAPPVGSIAPENLLLPFIDCGGLAAPKVGNPVYALLGGWIGGYSYTYQWSAGGSPIVGATSPTYIPVVGDETKTLTCLITGINPAGTTPVSTAASAAVTA